MNEQQTHWINTNYTASPSVTPEIRSRQRVFESFMCEADAGLISREEAIGRIRQIYQAGERLGQLAVIDNPELFDPERRL